jgi:hypothetical protein
LTKRRLIQTLIFCKNFYAQFCANVAGVQITSFDSDGKYAAIRALRELKKKGASKEIVRLFTWFEKLCDIYSDVVRAGYGEEIDEAIWAEFHTGYLVTLLERIISWAESAELGDLRRRASAALSSLKQSIERLAL